MLFRRRYRWRFLSFVMGIFSANFALSAPLFPQGTGWGDLLKGVVQEEPVPPGPLANLSNFNREASLYLIEAEPYHLSGPDGAILWRQSLKRFELSWPSTLYDFPLAIKIAADQRLTSGEVSGNDSRLVLKDPEGGIAVSAGGYWTKLRLKLGAGLRLSSTKSGGIFEHDYQFIWGADEGTSFGLRFFSIYPHGRFYWRIEEEFLNSDFAASTNGGVFEITFGDLFGPKATASFFDERLGKNQSGANNRLISVSCEQSGARIKLEEDGEKYDWRVSVRRSQLVGGALLEYNRTSEAESEDLNRTVTGINGGLSGGYGRKLRWGCEIAYDKISGSAGGWTTDVFPGRFGEAVSGGRYWAASGHLEGLRASGRIAAELESFKPFFEIGYCNYAAKLNIRDVSRQGGSVRRTALPVEGFVLLWMTPQLEFERKHLALRISISQALPISTRGAEDSPVGVPLNQKGGWIAAVSFGYSTAAAH